MSDHTRPYTFYGHTQSLCETCLAVVPAKIIFQDGNVYYLKRCLQHGARKTLVSTDIDYYLRCKQYLKPGDMPNVFQTPIHRGCPHDCGLCPDHEQHSCLALFEICDECNLECPVCFASSGPKKANYRSMADIERMLATLIESETRPDLVQVSGGEPTLHPEVLPILRRIKASPVRHLMLNTNGIRIAKDGEFVDELATLAPGFEVYLQFDSLRESALQNLRGADLRKIRLAALDALEQRNISTTLVCVIRKGVNDDEVDELITFAQGYRCVRGVSFQPVEYAGRCEGSGDRMTLSEIRSNIVAGKNAFGDLDMIPLPCHPENICIGYALKQGAAIHPITGLIPKDVLLRGPTNTIAFEQHPALKDAFLKVFSLDACSETTTESLQTMLCCLPRVEAGNLSYESVFRVVIMSFMDKYDFDLGSIKRSCTHFVEPDGKIYPFETWNLFYRDKARPVQLRSKETGVF